MKKLMIILVAGALCTASFAQKPAAEPKELKCSVMPDHMANIKKATKAKLFSDYEGRRYFFCCAGCKPAFDKDPKKYKDMPSIPTPKKKAVK
jgi:YHS domain-containing protein